MINASDSVCELCNGRKETIMNASDKDPDTVSYIEYYYKCPRCMGRGKLDWIDKLVTRDIQITIEKRIRRKFRSR